MKEKSIIYYLHKDIYFSFVNYLVKYLIISYLIVSINLTTFELAKIYSSSSIITIKIIGPGINSIVSAEFPNKSPKLSYVHINNINQENINNKYDFPEIENTVKITWNSGISNSQNLFENCINITHIDFSSNIDASYMFFGCSLLKEIIFPSKTIKLIGVIDMFNGCKSLTSLMVSYFNVSYVNDFSNMFKDCESLTSLDLSNFITNQQAPIKAMFSNCKNLVYLYFGNGIHFDKTKEYDLFFSGTRNLVVFTNCGTIQGIITLNYDCITWSREQNWKSYLLRFDVDNNKCINDSCTSLKKYEYLSKCYSTCPTGTYNSPNYKCNECHSD